MLGILSVGLICAWAERPGDVDSQTDSSMSRSVTAAAGLEDRFIIDHTVLRLCLVAEF